MMPAYSDVNGSFSPLLQLQPRPQGPQHVLDFDPRWCFDGHASVDSQPDSCSAVSRHKDYERCKEVGLDELLSCCVITELPSFTFKFLLKCFI